MVKLVVAVWCIMVCCGDVGCGAMYSLFWWECGMYIGVLLLCFVACVVAVAVWHVAECVVAVYGM